MATRFVGGKMRVEFLSRPGISARWTLRVRVTVMGSVKLVIAVADSW